MWVTRRSDVNTWDVGYFSPDGVWNMVMTFASFEDAIGRVHYLNGGD